MEFIATGATLGEVIIYGLVAAVAGILFGIILAAELCLRIQKRERKEL